MTRSELIQQLASKHPQLTSQDINFAICHILDGITNTLVKRGRVAIRGFGSFGINHRAPRKGRNPKTGAAVMVPAREVLRFKAGKELRERVNSPYRAQP